MAAPTSVAYPVKLVHPDGRSVVAYDTQSFVEATYDGFQLTGAYTAPPAQPNSLVTLAHVQALLAGLTPGGGGGGTKGDKGDDGDVGPRGYPGAILLAIGATVPADTPAGTAVYRRT